MFSDPFAFRADRSPNKHLAFGYGAHLCLGMHLTRMEMRILLEELIPRLKTLEFDGTPRMGGGCFINGPKSVPIRYTLN